MMIWINQWRKPEYPEETTDLRQVTDETFHTYGLCPVRGLNLGRSGVKQNPIGVKTYLDLPQYKSIQLGNPDTDLLALSRKCSVLIELLGSGRKSQTGSNLKPDSNDACSEEV